MAKSSSKENFEARNKARSKLKGPKAGDVVSVVREIDGKNVKLKGVIFSALKKGYNLQTENGEELHHIKASDLTVKSDKNAKRPKLTFVSVVQVDINVGGETVDAIEIVPVYAGFDHPLAASWIIKDTKKNMKIAQEFAKALPDIIESAKIKATSKATSVSLETPVPQFPLKDAVKNFGVVLKAMKKALRS